MDEEDCDYRTPIGKVIKHINTLCKKPQIDEQLCEALDVFHKKLEEQEKYLINGIFKTNFAEAALFLQSSTELYGKKVDALWDQLLEFHTRLIKYDCEHQKEKGLSVNKDVIEKLEERRNRYKRKKKFKLLLETPAVQKEGNFVFDGETENKKGVPNNEDGESKIMWKELEYKSTDMRKIPKIVYKQMTQTYRLKNYYILKCLDFEILDSEDGEFNTRYSRIPGWHHTQHLFEYNDKGLLPDKNNVIARLRLTAYGRIRFLISRGIPFNTPFEEYKEEYMSYRNKFFEDEAKKWQNMPLDTLQDLHKQLEYLVQKEIEENGESVLYEEYDGRYGFKNGHQLGRYGVKSNGQQGLNDKIEILDNSDEDSLFELSFSCDQNFMKSDLFIRLEKLSSEIINTKLRQDSGFYDFNSDTDNDCDDLETDANLDSSNKVDEDPATSPDKDNTIQSTGIIQEVNGDVEDVENDISKDAAGGDGTNVISSNTGDDTNVSKENDISKDTTDRDGTNDISHNDGDDANVTKEFDVGEDSIAYDQLSEHNYAEIANPDDNIDENHDNFETRSFISEHDYCLTIENNTIISGIDTNAEIVKDASIENSLEENNNLDKDVKGPLNKTVEDIFKKPFSNISRIVPKLVKIREKSQKQKIPKETSDGESPPKRRKLSQKQIDKLLQSQVKSVKQMKFEKFFSMNYQPQLGEGEVPVVDYESEDSDSENLDLDFLPYEDHTDENYADDNQVDEGHADDTRSIHSEHSDIQSMHSDHDYCQPATEDSHNDSGYVEAFCSQPSTVDEPIQASEQDNNSGEKNSSQSFAEEDTVISLEDEYERLLALLNESRKNQEKEAMETGGPRPPTERELQEIEEQKIRDRVEEWRGIINPILRNLKDHDFDIHEYGSKIMDGMEINESKRFGDIVQGETSAEVVRYFISSLQLANTCNIEICGAKQGQLSNDAYSVKLLSKDRYHEHLDEFLAPSEETLREKLDRVRAMRADEQASSDEPAAKKLNLKNTSSKEKRTVRTYTKKKTVENTSLSTNLSDNTPAVPSTSKTDVPQETSVEVQNSYQITPCETTHEPIAQENPNEPSNVVQPQEKSNTTENAQQQRLLSKGKSIIKRQFQRSQEPYLLNTDISMPSTSHDVHWPGSSSTYTSSSPFEADIDPQMPSTSFQSFSSFSSTSFDDVSPNKRRRESTEELFRERLVTVQEMNPDIQFQSTPNTSSPLKKIKTSMSLKRSLLFE